MNAPALPLPLDALTAAGPAPDRAAQMMLYGRLIGRWIFDATIYPEGGTPLRGEGRIAFGWALEGRAIQDVWVLPGMFHGTTLRVYDPGLDAWHILWSDPLRQYYSRQIGRARGADIVQEGSDDTGARTRWSFTEMTADGFRWLGETGDGTAWRVRADFRARRIGV